MPRSQLAFFTCLALSGCYPVRNSYEYLEVPNARYFQRDCYFSSGPPSVAYFPYHGIFISLDVTYLVSFGLHLPEGNTVELNGNTVRIVGTGTFGPIDMFLPIQAIRHATGPSKPAEFYGLQVDPFTSKDNFGPLIGDTGHGNYLWFDYISADGQSPSHYVLTPRDVIRGTVELPSISINGQIYQPEPISFERRTVFNILPINC